MANNTCKRFAQTLGGKIMSSSDDSCVVMKMRNIDATILSRPTMSPLALAAMFSYEDPDNQGCTLNLGETVILAREINPFISKLRDSGIKVTALHNHWLFENPRLMYIHFESIEDPIDFAEKVADAFTVLNGRVDDTED